MQTLQMASNPMSAIQSMISTNPQLQQLIPLIQKNNGDYQKTFYDLARERGVNPDEVINLVKRCTSN